MPLTTPQNLITLALKTVGVLGVGNSAQAEDNNDMFDVLNGMLGSWNRKRWLIYHLLDKSVVTTGAQSYSIGPGGSINVPRPDRIESAFFRQLNTSGGGQIDYPLELLESREDYNRIALKSLVAWPQYLFYDAAFPLGYLYPWSVPQASLYELHVSIKDTLGQFSTLTQTINLPDEYHEALWTNLAVRGAAIFPGSVLNDETRGLAKASIATIRGANAQIPRLSMPPGLGSGGRYNIYSDQVTG